MIASTILLLSSALHHAARKSLLENQLYNLSSRTHRCIFHHTVTTTCLPHTLTISVSIAPHKGIHRRHYRTAHTGQTPSPGRTGPRDGHPEIVHTGLLPVPPQNQCEPLAAERARSHRRDRTCNQQFSLKIVS
jgi:hypothetical protein